MTTLQNPIKSDLTLTRSLSEFRFDGNSRFEGYAAVFNSPTLIDSWEGRFTEQFMPGAFRNTLKQRGDKVKMLFDHGRDPSVGNMPIAKIDRLTEDDRGLLVRATLLDTQAGRDVGTAVAAGALDGMSFRFSVVRDQWDESADIPSRTVQEARLDEVSVVTFPAYADTTAAVRSTFVEWMVTRAPADSGSAIPGPADPGRQERKNRIEAMRSYLK